MAFRMDTCLERHRVYREQTAGLFECDRKCDLERARRQRACWRDRWPLRTEKRRDRIFGRRRRVRLSCYSATFGEISYRSRQSKLRRRQCKFLRNLHQEATLIRRLRSRSVRDTPQRRHCRRSQPNRFFDQQTVRDPQVSPPAAALPSART